MEEAEHAHTRHAQEVAELTQRAEESAAAAAKHSALQLQGQRAAGAAAAAAAEEQLRDKEEQLREKLGPSDDTPVALLSFLPWHPLSFQPRSPSLPLRPRPWHPMPSLLITRRSLVTH